MPYGVLLSQTCLEEHAVKTAAPDPTRECKGLLLLKVASGYQQFQSDEVFLTILCSDMCCKQNQALCAHVSFRLKPRSLAAGCVVDTAVGARAHKLVAAQLCHNWSKMGIQMSSECIQVCSIHVLYIHVYSRNVQNLHAKHLHAHVKCVPRMHFTPSILHKKLLPDITYFVMGPSPVPAEEAKGIILSPPYSNLAPAASRPSSSIACSAC